MGHILHLCFATVLLSKLSLAAIGSSCSGTGLGTCLDNMNLVCEGETKCACTEHYEEKNNVCTLTVTGTTCTSTGDECEAIDNAECNTEDGSDDGTCHCSPGFVMNVDVCAAENSARTTEFETVTLVLCASLTVLKALG